MTEGAREAPKAILIVDDHPILRRGLAALIESETDLRVCAQVSTRDAALAALVEHGPDLVTVDIELENEDGLSLVKEIKVRQPDVPTLVLSMHDEGVYAERALRAGAAGYVTKQQLDETVLLAIRRVLAGETYMSETLTARLAAKYVAGGGSAPGSPLQALSDRELQVFRLVGQSRTTRQIAQALGLSVKTIESHLEHIKNKLAITTASELAGYAVRWVETGEY